MSLSFLLIRGQIAVNNLDFAAFGQEFHKPESWVDHDGSRLPWERVASAGNITLRFWPLPSIDILCFSLDHCEGSRQSYRTLSLPNIKHISFASGRWHQYSHTRVLMRLTNSEVPVYQENRTWVVPRSPLKIRLAVKVRRC